MVAAVEPMGPDVPRTPGTRMARPAPATALFRFAPPAPGDAEAGEERRPTDDAAAWRGPVLACGATVAATAGLAFAVLTPGEDARRPAAPVPAAGTVILSAASEPAAEPGERPAREVVSALHVWDGRPVRAVPTDTLPDPLSEPGGLTLADGVAPAVGFTVRDTVPAGRAVPAIWLTGEIAD